MDGRINFMSIAEISINYNGGNELKPTEETITINRNDTAKRSEKNHTQTNIVYVNCGGAAKVSGYCNAIGNEQFRNFSRLR